LTESSPSAEAIESSRAIEPGASATAVNAKAADLPKQAVRVGNYRWVICALLFFATTINYIDRQVIGILAKDLQTIIGWSEIEYGNIAAAFSVAYAVGLLVSGRLIDRFGTRIGYGIAIVIWSLAGMATSFARSALGFGIARAALGLGESANFPAAIKTVAEWFPKKERAFATGIFNAGTNVGAIVAPLTVPWIAINFGWRWAFILTGLVGFLWLLFWLPRYRRPEEHPKLSSEELAYIRSDPPDPPVAAVPWIKLIPHRETCAFAIGKYLTDPIWWFYLYWIPNFLRSKHGLDLTTVGLPLIAIYLIADVGSVGGGWLSSFLIGRGWTINRARKITMLACALLVTPIVFASTTSNLWVAVSLIGLAAAAHQGWSANLFTTTSDMFPRRGVGSVVGLGGMAGAMGGATMAVLTGFILDRTGGNYMIVFWIAASAYLVALAIIHLLAPKLELVEDLERRGRGFFTIGSLLGFGFSGLVLGSFAGWCVALIAKQSGERLLGYMMAGAVIGIFAGIAAGYVSSLAGKSKRSS
jgi:ACS family hexuronate transporter-like MFS transporter